jgi:ATP-dependent DNA helicase PIF1
MTSTISILPWRIWLPGLVVCPTNSVVDDVNSFMVTKVLGCVKEYLSSDGIANGAEQPSDFELLYPPEFLNSICINNFPQHRLLLKPEFRLFC